MVDSKRSQNLYWEAGLNRLVETPAVAEIARKEGIQDVLPGKAGAGRFNSFPQPPSIQALTPFETPMRPPECSIFRDPDGN